MPQAEVWVLNQLCAKQAPKVKHHVYLCSGLNGARPFNPHIVYGLAWADAQRVDQITGYEDTCQTQKRIMGIHHVLCVDCNTRFVLLHLSCPGLHGSAQPLFPPSPQRPEPSRHRLYQQEMTRQNLASQNCKSKLQNRLHTHMNTQYLIKNKQTNEVYGDLTVIIHEDLWRVCETTFRV